MSEDRIERDTLIAAPLDRVWSLVSEPGFWVSQEASIWAGDEAGLAGVEASEGASMMAKNPNLGEVGVRVEKVEPPTYVAYRWSSAFPGQELRDRSIRFNAEGWPQVFEAIKNRAEQA